VSFIQDRIYPILPVSLQNAAISAFGYKWYKRRFGGIFKEEYEGFKKREEYSKEQWYEYQTLQLRKMLLHSFNTVPYYKHAFTNAGFTTSKFEKFELTQLATLPILEKNTLREKGTSDLLSNKPEFGGSFYSSSGSTGTPTRIMYSYNMHQRLSAVYEARVRNWAGVSKDNARGMIGGRRVIANGVARPPYYRYNAIEKQVYLSAYHISRNTVADYVKGLKKYNTEYLVGYAASNYTLARFIKEAGASVPKMKAVLTSSEKLTPSMRATIADVYKCKVHDAYSGVEWCGLISENEHRQLLISPDCAYLEIIKSDGTSASPGEEGELVCTGFLNYDQPLIRYKIGDVVKLSADQYTKCGRSFGVVDEIIGRVEDTVIGKDGREMVRFHAIFANLPNVVKGQVVQEDYEHFTVNVQTKGLTATEKETIDKRMKSQLGNIELVINELSDIPVSANGKFKAVISKLVQS
jgi:phenylacetate-CoA ligase